jgi:uncharacterized protein (DUF2236 family)
MHVEEVVARVAARARGRREGLFGPGSAHWTLLRETALLLGGPRALLMQLAHPAISSGIEQHSKIASDPLGRSVRTFEAMYTLCFGDLDSALRVVRSVWRRHDVVVGRVEAGGASPWGGAPYRALDPSLLVWVYATLFDTTVRTFETFVRPLGASERETFYEEGKVLQAAFGVPDGAMLPTLAAFDAHIAGVLGGTDLDVSAHARGQWDTLVRQPPSHALLSALMLPRSRVVQVLIDDGPARVLAPAALRLFAAGMLPERLRAAYGCRWTRADASAFALVVQAARWSYARLPAAVRLHAAYRRAIERTGHLAAA